MHAISHFQGDGKIDEDSITTVRVVDNMHSYSISIRRFCKLRHCRPWRPKTSPMDRHCQQWIDREWRLKSLFPPMAVAISMPTIAIQWQYTFRNHYLSPMSFRTLIKTDVVLNDIAKFRVYETAATNTTEPMTTLAPMVTGAIGCRFK